MSVRLRTTFVAGFCLLSTVFATIIFRWQTAGPHAITTVPMERIVEGVVIGPQGPVSGALVRYQGTAVTTLTDANGRYQLPAATQRPLTITASDKAHFIGSVRADSDSVGPIRLKPLPTTDCSTYAWVDPTPDGSSEARCGNCHREIYNEWQGSGHAGSATNARFWSLYESLLVEQPHGADVCMSCHFPGVSLDHAAVRGPQMLTGVDALGVHCDFCHKIQSVENNAIGISHGRFAVTLLRPQQGQLFFGPFDDVDRQEDVYSAVQRESLYCASCHEGIMFGTHVYSTYSEWLRSPAAREGKTCQTCHMAPTGTMTNVAPDHGGIERDPQNLASHSMMPGGRLEMLRRSVQVAISIREKLVDIQVVATNVGHQVPTGFIDRHLLLVVDFFDDRGERIEMDTELRLGDAAGPDFAGRTGRLFARLLTAADGSQPIPFWRAIHEPTDTRLHPNLPVSLEFAIPEFSQRFRVQLLYRRFWPATSQEHTWPDDTLIVFDESQVLEVRWQAENR